MLGTKWFFLFNANLSPLASSNFFREALKLVSSSLSPRSSRHCAAINLIVSVIKFKCFGVLIWLASKVIGKRVLKFAVQLTSPLNIKLRAISPLCTSLLAHILVLFSRWCQDLNPPSEMFLLWNYYKPWVVGYWWSLRELYILFYRWFYRSSLHDAFWASLNWIFDFFHISASAET